MTKLKNFLPLTLLTIVAISVVLYKTSSLNNSVDSFKKLIYASTTELPYKTYEPYKGKCFINFIILG